MDKAELKALLADLPGMKPPPGVIPNLIDPPTKGNLNLLCHVACISFSTVCVLIRMYTRIFINRAHGWEDYTCFVAWLVLLTYSSMQLLPIFMLFPGVHQWNVKIKYLGTWGRLSYIIEIIYIPGIFLAKLSILLLYLRIFVPLKYSKTWFAIHTILWSNFFFYLPNIFTEIFVCTPRERFWDPTVDGHCIKNDVVLITGGVINLISDFGILFIPLVCIGRLQMPLARKIGLSAVFGTGFFACISSVMHLVTSIKLNGDPDKTYLLFPLALWTTAELASGVIISSLLVMPHFFRHVAPRIASKFSSSRKTPKDSKGSGPEKPAPDDPKQQSKPPHWHDLYDTTTSSRQDAYLELNESHDWHSPTTTIHGGTQPVSETNGWKELVVSEESAMEAGIMKTVHVEQYQVSRP